LGINADSIRFNSYSTVALNSAGAVSGIATKKPVSWPSSLTPNTVQTSLGDTVYLSSLTMNIGANALTLSVGSLPSAATTAAFSSASYNAGGGKSYVLTLKLKQAMFASSNIYWDAANSRLTFKGYSDTPRTTYGDTVQYQGVFFRFGSLVGISPVGSGSAATVYIPTYLPGDPLNSTWDDGGTVASRFGSWYGVPTDSSGTSTDTKNRYVSDLGLSLVDQNKGDICLYLEHTGAAPPPHRAGLHWRLPAAAEFGSGAGNWTASSYSGWTKVAPSWGTDPGTTSADGTYKGISWGGNFGVTANFFPASGIRYISNGNLSQVGNYGLNWSSSAGSSTNRGYTLYLHTNSVATNYDELRQYGFAVRCVLQE
jgi:hypothetical protein